MELKLRSLPVSGTKTDLIERLRLYQETSNLQTAAASVEKTVIAEAPQPENAKLSPPVSPIASRVSSLGIEDRGAVDGPAQLAVTAVSAHSVGSAVEESPTDKRSPEKASEKDKRLHEKERQIEELMRKLEQEQRLVEELKMQLEVEKRSQHSDSPPHFSPLQVKEENMSPSSCSGACSSPGLIKQEHVEDPVTQVLQSHFVMSQQTAKPPELEQPAEAGAHILLAAPFPATTIAIQLPTSSIILHSPDNSAALGLLPPAAQMPPNAEASQQQCGGQPKVRGHTEMIPIYFGKSTKLSLCLRAGENAGEVNASIQHVLLSVSVCRPGGSTAQPSLTRFQWGDVLREPPPAKLTAKTLQMW